MKKRKDTFYFSEPRRNILKLLKEKSYNQLELSNKLNLSRATIQHHISILQGEGLVKIERKQNVKGRPVIITIPENKILEIQKQEQRNKKHLLEVLKAIKRKGGIININDLESLTPLPNNRKDWAYQSSIKANLLISDMVEHLIRISEEGKKFIKENE